MYRKYIFVGRASVETFGSIFGRFFFSYIDGEWIREKVRFYNSQLSFPAKRSREFRQLTTEVQEKVMHFCPDLNANFLEWLQSFDRDNNFNIKLKNGMLIANKPLECVRRLLNVILDEMEETALAILDARGEDNVEWCQWSKPWWNIPLSLTLYLMNSNFVCFLFTHGLS